MIRIISKLVLIFLALYLATSTGYSRLEKRLLTALPEKKKSSTVISAALPPSPAVASSDANDLDYDTIITRNIFQATLENNKTPPEAARVESLPPTTLQLSLQGTVAGGQSAARAVILDEKSKKQNIYRLNDSIEGAVIKAIERGKVILEVNGRTEVLLIKDRTGEPGVAAPLINSPRSTAPTTRRQKVSPPSRTAGPAGSMPTRRMTLRQPAGMPADTGPASTGEEVDASASEEEEPQVLAPEPEETTDEGMLEINPPPLGGE